MNEKQVKRMRRAARVYLQTESPKVGPKAAEIVIRHMNYIREAWPVLNASSRGVVGAVLNNLDIEQAAQKTKELVTLAA